MTREEAIQILADLIDSPFLHTWEKQNKALHMAIEALSAKPTISMFAESEEAYKAWTGEEIGGGRLIDADFEEQHYASILLNPSPDVTAKDRDNARIILDALKMAKTVSADRPQGEWIHEGIESKNSVTGRFNLPSCCCSECGLYVIQESNFCPNCGADMRGGEAE